MTCICGQRITYAFSTRHHEGARAQALARQAHSLSHHPMAGKSLHVTKRLVDQAPRSKGPMTARAMINVDGSPPLFLGAGMIVAGAVLYQLRNSRPYITKDFDIVLSCIAIFAGGILVFQGWRLDPLLLFGQLLTAGAALSFGVEALRLREIVHKKELSETGSYDQQIAQPGVDPRYPEALSLPRAWDQAQPPTQSEAYSSQGPRPWWEEQQARATQYDQGMPATGSQSRQESWPSSASASSQQSNVSIQREDGQQLLLQQQQPQQRKVPSASQQPQQPQNRRTQKIWGSDIDLNSLDDWDSD